MADVLTPLQRHRNMAAIRSKDTKPEILVRKIVHQMGFRFRLHRQDLLGKPDIVLPKHHKIIFVHGCFWHMHRCKYGSVKPQTNSRFWQEKRTQNVERDRRNIRTLRKDGWQILVIWECWTRDLIKLENKLLAFLNS